MKPSIQKTRSCGIAGWTLIVFISATLSCSKDDDPKMDIETQPTEVSFIKVNTCYVGGGVYNTEFNFIIPYQTSSPDIEIEKIHYSVSVAGTFLGEKDDYSFDDDGSEISFGFCIQFDGAPGIDFTSSLISKDGRQSKPSKVKIDRPAGAN